MSDKSKQRITLAGRLAVALVLAATTYILPAYGACVEGSTQWRTVGCCECNSGRKQTLYSCDNGVWKSTGYTQCNTSSSCCAYPCCV